MPVALHDRIHSIVWELFPEDHLIHQRDGDPYLLIENGATNYHSITIGHRGHTNFYVHDNGINIYPVQGMIDLVNQRDALLIQLACEDRGISLPINYHLSS